MKKLLVVLSLFLMAGCSPSAREKNFPILPEELKDCKFFRLTDGDGNSITVARCPNSSTTVRQSDKPGTTSVIIDGKEYTAR